MSPISQHKQQRKERGFTLIEALVYVAILVLVSGVLVSIFLSLDTVLLRNKTERALTNSAQVTLERMVRDIREATSANTSLSGQLTLTTPATTTVFKIVNGKIVVEVNGTEIGPLTGERIKVENLSFSQYNASGTDYTTDFVRAAVTLTATSTAASSTRSYFIGAVMRGSYE